MSESVNPTGAEPDALSALRRRLEGRTADEQGRALTALVREQARDVLRTVLPDGPDAVEPGRPFRDLGFDSLAAVELHRGSPWPPASTCRPPWSSTTRRRRPSAGCCGRCSAATPHPPRPPRRCAVPPPTTSRSPIVGMGCRYPGGVQLARGPVAAGRRRRRRDRPTSRPTAAGTSTRSTTRTRTGPAAPTSARAASSTTRPSSTPDFFGISPARGAGDGPAAAAAAGDRLGGVRARRHRPGVAARQPDRRLRRRRRTRTTAPGCTRRPEDLEGYLLTGNAGERGLRPASPTPSAWRARRSPSTPPARRRWSPCTWPRRRCAQGECDLALAGGVDGDGAPRARSSSSAGSAGWPPTAAARRSPAAPTAPAGPRASACCCWSGSPTPAATATGCSP